MRRPRRRHDRRSIALKWLAAIALLVAPAALYGCASDDQQENASATTAGDTADALTSTMKRGPVSVTLTASKAGVTVGEKLELQLAVAAEQGVQVDMPVVEQELGAFTVRQRRTPPDVPDGSIRRWDHVYVLDTFATGPVEIPSLEVQFTDARDETVAEHGEPVTAIVVTDPITIEVSSVLSGDETDEDFRDIRGAVDVPIDSERTWLGILIGAVVAAGTSAVVVLLLILLLRRRAGADQKQAPPRPAHVIALAELQQLEADRLIESGRQHEFYYRLSDIVRQYIERRFGMMAPERTTDEFLREAGRDPRLHPAHRELLGQFLRTADMVKFARLTPADEDAAAALSQARGFITDTAVHSSDNAEAPAQPVEAVT